VAPGSAGMGPGAGQSRRTEATPFVAVDKVWPALRPARPWPGPRCWWNQTEAEQVFRPAATDLAQPPAPIGLNCSAKWIGLARVASELAAARGFAEEGPYWSRHYRFFRGGRELTVIREVFSRSSSTCLGPASSS